MARRCGLLGLLLLGLLGGPSCLTSFRWRRTAPRTARSAGRSDEAAALRGLAATGAVVGPMVDAIHNQALLRYDILPVAVSLPLGLACSSLLVPPLLAVAYVLLGRVLPALAGPQEPVKPLPLLQLKALPRAILAVLSTCLVIKSSELLLPLSGSVALLLLSLLVILQWACLDGRLSSLALALLPGVMGPICELPLIYLGAWHYISPDYWPLSFLGLGPTTWAGLSMVTGPCYFAVTTDAIALGRLFAQKGDAPPLRFRLGVHRGSPTLAA